MSDIASDEIHEFLEFSRCFSFSGADVQLLVSPVVYVLMRGEEAMYVGMSVQGAHRPFDPLHHVLRKKIQVTDKLLIWPVKDGACAREMELELIWRLNPAWNSRETRRQPRLVALKREDSGVRVDAMLVIDNAEHDLVSS